jgi:hypothetical protein
MSDEELIQTLNESECEEDQEDDQGGRRKLSPVCKAKFRAAEEL